MIFSKNRIAIWLLCSLGPILGGLSDSDARANCQKTKALLPKRVVLLWQGPDGHKPTTHEFEAGIRLLGNMLQRHTRHHVILSKADEKWEDGPELLERADTVVMFISQGSRWIQQTPARLKLFQDYAHRGGGLVAFHWAIGSKADEDIAAFLPLLGATHGGKDRKYDFLKTRFRPTTENHPIQYGLRPIEIEDEFYYNLKQFKSPSPIIPIMESKMKDGWSMTAWAWERPQGGALSASADYTITATGARRSTADSFCKVSCGPWKKKFPPKVSMSALKRNGSHCPYFRTINNTN